MLRSLTLLALAAGFIPAAQAGNCGNVPGGDREVVVEWNALLEGAVPNSAGPTLPRYYAMMHIAMFDAVNSIDGGYVPYRATVPVGCEASTEAAAAQAAHDVLVALLPAGQASFDAALAARLATLHPVRVRLGTPVGIEIAKQILEWRTNDGWAPPKSFTPPALPGVWQPTPPAFAAATFVQAGDAKPFGLPTPHYYLPRRPPELNSQEYADALNDIKAIGGATSAVRTAEQTQLARAWASVNYRQQWSAIWNNVTRDAARSKGLNLIETARLFALVNATMHDSVQTAQASKFVYKLWRPVTAIQRAGEDMNDGTTADPTWMPLLTTPPYPSYAGNMACIGAGVSRSLALFFGTNDIPVTARWTGINGNADVAMSYPGFWQLAEAQGVSREYGGIHYRFDTTASQEVCPKVAGYIYANYARPKNTH
jgi:hypothetical protein